MVELLLKLVSAIKEELLVVKKAPFTFIVLGILFFGIGFGLSSFLSSNHISLIEKQLSLKKEKLQEYKDRLHERRPLLTKYGALTHKELQQSVFELVTGIRSLLAWFEKKEIVLFKSGNHAEHDKLFLEMKDEYEKRFRTEAVALFEEVIKRLPDSEFRKIEYSRNFQYQYPTNSLGMKWVANHLELLSKQLSFGEKYSNLTSQAITDSRRNLIKGINDLISWYKSEMQNAKGDEIAKKELKIDLQYQYQINYRSEAVLIYQSLLERIPKDKYDKNFEMFARIIEQPRTTKDLETIVNLLNKLETILTNA